MRWLALVAVLGAVAAVVWTATKPHHQPPPLQLALLPGMASPYPDDTYILGLRTWSVAADLKVFARRSCDDVRVTAGKQYFFDRRPLAGVAEQIYELGAMRTGATRTVSLGSDADDAGVTVLVRVAVTCDGRTARVERRLALPAESCFGGPIHVYAVRGAVTANGGQLDYPPTLRSGDLVGEGTIVAVPRGGRVLLGATECNNFHVAFGPGRYISGTYDFGGRGDAFGGRNAFVVGDQHVGGFAIAGKGIVEPIGRTCRSCSPSAVSFEARTQSARRATIRVFRGAVRVVAGKHRHVGRALAGQQIDVLCRRECVPTRPRLWQPGEPWTTTPAPRALPLPRVLHARRPAAAALAPARAHVVIYDLRASGGAPEQLAILWQREIRRGAGREARNVETQQGLIVWQRGGRRVWRRVFSRRFAIFDAPPSVKTGDVTGDGHPDVLVTLEQGSGACGPREVFATVRARIRRIFYRNECESFVRIKGGAVDLIEPVGRCPVKEGSAHCFGGNAHIVERWNGQRLVVTSRVVRCIWPRLDPAADCNRRKRG